MIDLHSHILPRIDDGPASDRDSLTMARLCAEEGVTTVACTPHRGYSYDTTPGQVGAAIAELQAQIDAAGITLRLVPGLEVAIDRAVKMDDAELRDATLGASGRWLLIEMPFQGWPLELPDLLTALELRGLSALIAHPERAQSVQTRPDRMRDIVGRGALVQLTAASLTGDNGPRARRCSEQLLATGMAHVIASDTHSPKWRPPGLRDGLTAAAAILRCEPDDLHWMVDDIPRAILDGEDVKVPTLPGKLKTPMAPQPRQRRPPRR